MSARASAVFDLPAAERSALRCTGCTRRACDSLRQISGVGHVDCDGAAGKVRVEFDPGVVAEETIETALARHGLDLQESFGHAAWRVEGLD